MEDEHEHGDEQTATVVAFQKIKPATALNKLVLFNSLVKGFDLSNGAPRVDLTLMSELVESLKRFFVTTLKYKPSRGF